MADTKIPMTPRGAQLLKDELKRRKEVDRYKIVKAIEEARGHGDLSENADYSAAKEAQGFNEGRIKELEVMLALSNVIDPKSLSGNKVRARFPLSEPGAFVMQVLADVGAGPRPVLEANVYADVEPPARTPNLAAPGERAMEGQAGAAALYAIT